MKLQAGNLNLVDFFTPLNVDASYDGFADLNDHDLDVGGGIVVLPEETSSVHLMVSAGKEGRIYLPQTGCNLRLSGNSADRYR